MARPRGIGDVVLQLLTEGHTHAEVITILSCSKSTVSHHAKKLERRRRGSRPTYNWEEVQAYDDAGHGLTACIERFGFSRAAWGKAIQRGQIRPRARGRPFDDLLTIERRTQRTHLKMRLLRAGLLRAECFECGLTEWRGRPLSLELDHVNGTKLDTRLENLRLLCPNCHSQTETYAGRNKRSSGHRLRDLRGCYYVNCGASAVAAKKENSLGGG